MPDWRTLLTFWFGDLCDGLADARHRQQWFTPDRGFDDLCASQFGHWLQAAALGELQYWLNDAQSSLAFIILTDQMPRNIHRGTAQAFAWDHLARQAALDGVQKGFDMKLGWDERCFFYMPFEHSETLLDQHLAVGLFTALRDASPKNIRNTTGSNLRYAQQHRDIILRFGRFPHRNHVLGRTSSPQELAFTAGSDGFGQGNAST